MRPSVRVVLVALVLISHAFGCNSFAQAPVHKPIVPLPPGELLKLLPGTPPRWTLAVSTANNNFSDWLSSRATRTFRYVPPPSASGLESPPQTARLSILDTGYFPEAMGEFIGFRPGKEREVEKTIINSMPAIKITRGSTELLSILIKRRFVIQIRTDNQGANSTGAWFKLFDVGKLAAVSDAAADKIAQPVTIIQIDELDPKKNTSYPLIWASEEQQKQDAAREQAAEKAKRPR